MAITNTFLSTTNATAVFTAANDEAITTIYLCNTTASNVSANVYCIDGGGTAANSNQIFNGLIIQGNDTYAIDTAKLVLASADEIEVSANVANVVSVTVSSIAI